MKLTEVLEEQVLQNMRDKLKTATQNVGNKISSIVNRNQTPNTPQQSTQTTGRTYEQVKAEWSKINQDMSDMRSFGEAVAQTQSSAQMASYFNARTILLKKMGKQQASFGSYPVDEATFQLPNGNYQHLVLMQLNTEK
jgi:hypothetical protein